MLSYPFINASIVEVLAAARGGEAGIRLDGPVAMGADKTVLAVPLFGRLAIRNNATSGGLLGIFGVFVRNIGLGCCGWKSPESSGLLGLWRCCGYGEVSRPGILELGAPIALRGTRLTFTDRHRSDRERLEQVCQLAWCDWISLATVFAPWRLSHGVKVLQQVLGRDLLGSAERSLDIGEQLNPACLGVLIGGAERQRSGPRSSCGFQARCSGVSLEPSGW